MFALAFVPVVVCISFFAVVLHGLWIGFAYGNKMVLLDLHDGCFAEAKFLELRDIQEVVNMRGDLKNIEVVPVFEFL